MSMNTSSFVVFQKFVKYLEDGTVDVSKVFSKDCYVYWLSTRSVPPKRPEESFRKAITSHCRGVDGRKPFPREIEAALLKEMRKKQVWPCFRDTPFNIGKRGYQVRGFWEASNDFKASAEGGSVARSNVGIGLSKKRKGEVFMPSDLKKFKVANFQSPENSLLASTAGKYAGLTSLQASPSFTPNMGTLPNLDLANMELFKSLSASNNPLSVPQLPTNTQTLMQNLAMIQHLTQQTQASTTLPSFAAASGVPQMNGNLFDQTNLLNNYNLMQSFPVTIPMGKLMNLLDQNKTNMQSIQNL